MNKYKYLLKNVGLLTISNFGTKILSFILIPIYTNYLTTAEYGTFDIYATTISLLTPLLTLNIIEAVMRFSLDTNSLKKDIFSIGIKHIAISIFILMVFVIINKVIGIFPILNEYWILFLLLYITDVFYSICTQFSRGLEKVKSIAISGAMNTIVLLLLNVTFLVYFKMGLKGYFLSYILSYIFPTLYLILKNNLYNYIKVEKLDKTTSKIMKKYSIPLIFNTIGWWINNVSDRYIVTWICGVNANGVYSIAYKIPSILNVLQSIFSQAWTLSAVKEINNKKNDFYLKIYKIYNLVFVLTCSLLILLDKPIAYILFSNEFFNAWKYAPFLMISVVFGSLSGLLGGIFSAVKNSKIFANTTMYGAIINTILNVILVKVIGPLGASIATLCAYIVVWGIRLYYAKRIVNLNIDLYKDIISYVILIIQSIAILIIKNNIIFWIEILLIIILIILNVSDIKILIKNILNFIKRRKNEKITDYQK